jgi:Spy/CpxP family protein refolding chaperone
MKKMLILLAAFTLTAGAANAQTSAPTPAPIRIDRDQVGNKTPEQRAEARTQQLAKSLSLTAEQTEKVRQLNLAQAKEMQAVRTKNAANREEAKAARDRHDAQLKAILSADQYTKYDQQRTERMNKRKDRMKARG